MKITLFALLGFISISAPLATRGAQFGDFTYAPVGLGITITGYTGPGGAVSIPASITGLPVTTIGDFAFDNKSSLTGITIPGSVTTIGLQAFTSCNGLTNVALPGSVTSIATYAFANCASLVTIAVAAANGSYSSLDGVLFNKGRTTLIQYPAGKTGSYPIPVSVTKIGDGAFSSCHSLTSVAISGSVRSIGTQAFPFCTRLTSVTIPGSVTNIGESAFAACTRLTNVTFLNGVTRIGDVMFYHCTNLANVTLPGSVTGIGVGAFFDCSGLIAITIPSGVTDIANLAFVNCASLQGLFFKGNAPSVGSDVFSGAFDANVYYLPGTTGWIATLGGVPARLWNPLIQTSGPSFGVGPAGFRFNINGTADIPIVLEACTNLTDATWVPLQGLNLTNGAFHFSDPNWTNYPARNYRIRSP